ncbi:methyl-accepting chemotaxis protein [Tardiphaga alba]|uniref:Methyl-accepting chemotaxis protein n=1 Tax=Tardiphaga alba TaxID=340268 RepID=A0ABX8AH47_9BRAD|nr:HAMP domain-containing methyl-accepting chemotaxis protein [Tardiphaga alba]QUS41695.1 methyl-accepting chemotaxis protein [Tardiphaga alba]
MSLLNLRIRGRLYGGFGALVLFGLVGSGFAMWQMSEVGTQVGSLSIQSANTIRAAEIASELHATRGAILRYSFDQDEAALADADKRLARLSTSIQTVIQSSRSEERRAAYRTIEKDVAEVKTQRQALGEAVKQVVAGREVLQEAGDKLSSSLRKLAISTRNTPYGQGSTKLESDTLLVQIANWRYFVSRDEKQIASFNDQVRIAEQQIGEMEKMQMPPTLAALFGTIRTNLKSYASLFEKASKSLQTADAIFQKSISPTIIHAIAQVDVVKSGIQEAQAQTVAATNERISTTTMLQQIVAGVVTVVGILIAMLIARGIIGPLAGLTAGMKELAEGNFSVVLPGVNRKDEVGDMARAVEGFKIKAEEKARAEAEAKLTQDQQAALQRRRDMVRLADDFEGAVGSIVENVSSASGQLEQSATALTTTAEQAKQLTAMVSAASDEASSNVQAVASSTEEMSSSVNEISRQVQESANIANSAVSQARKTNERVAELARAAARIGDVVELINTIAGQTNLLALNATIEAARAGDAGRGFAVVASEVKALAEQTAKATGDISHQISGIQAATEESVGAIKEIGDTIGRMSEIASTIASAVEQQGAATQEIARNVQQAAQGTMQVSANITDVQRGATSTGSASSQVLSAAQSLSTESARLKREVGKFLETVRAA